MEQQEREERLNQYAKEKVVARLVKSVKEETEKQEVMKKVYAGHAPNFDKEAYDNWIKARGLK